MKKEKIEMVWNQKKVCQKEDTTFLNAKAIEFHKSLSAYQKTPLVCLKNLAEKLDVNNIFIKDESFRFGLNAFKVLGASYAIANYISQKTGQNIKEVLKTKVEPTTFVTATDGNHGRGVAWTAKQLGQKAVVYMPKGSSQERLNNIIVEGAEAKITNMNYDDAVRFSEQKAKENGWIVVQDTAWEGYIDIPTWIMQGYTTMGQEIMEQLQGQKITHIFLQAGVGSMAGAITGFFVNHYQEEKPVIAVVEPTKADCLYQTAKANDGTLHCVTGDMNTIMAGLACGEPCSIGWNILKNYAEAFFRCPEYIAADGMRILAAPVKGDAAVISGESGAAGFGCMVNILQDKALEEMKNKLKLDKNSNILCISTEGDTDAQNYQNVVWGGKYSKFEN